MDLCRKNDKKSNRTRQKNKRGDRKGESNDSPEIPNRRKTSDIPGLPSEMGVVCVCVEGGVGGGMRTKLHKPKNEMTRARPMMSCM